MNKEKVMFYVGISNCLNLNPPLFFGPLSWSKATHIARCNAPIKFEEIVTIMINFGILFLIGLL